MPKSKQVQYHGRRKHFYSDEAIGGIKTVSCSVEVVGGSGGMTLENFRDSQIESGAILGFKYQLQ